MNTFDYQCSWMELPEQVRLYPRGQGEVKGPPLPSGATPQQLIDEASLMLPRAHDALVPPLYPVDVVCILGDAIAAQHYYVPFRQVEGLPFDALPQGIAEVGVGIVAVANTAYARYAGLTALLQLPSPQDYADQLRRQYARWCETVRQPALTGEDMSDRAQCLREAWMRIFHYGWNPNIEKSCRRLEAAFVNNIGGNEGNPRRREDVPLPVLHGLAQFTSQIGAQGVWCVENGQVVAQSSALAALFATAFEQGIRRDPNCLSLDAVQEQSPAQGAFIHDLAVLADLRSARESLDSRHRILGEALELARRKTESGVPTAWARAVAGVAASVERCPPGLQAALSYVLMEQCVRQSDVAELYGVSRDQVQYALPEARQIVQRLMAA